MLLFTNNILGDKIRVLKIAIVILILAMSVGVVSAADLSDGLEGDNCLQTDQNDDVKRDDNIDNLESPQSNEGEGSFTDLGGEIDAAGDSLDLSRDYKFNNDTDNNTGIVISKDNFVLDGKGHTIDGNNLSRIFNITGNNIKLTNLIIKGGNFEKAGGIYASGNLILNNISFINNYAKKEGGAIGLYGNNSSLICDYCQFIDNYANEASSIKVDNGTLNISNSNISSVMFNKYAQIICFMGSTVYGENLIFTNCSSSYAPAFYFRGCKSSIINSKFINLRGNISSGAIAHIAGGYLHIKSCEFKNISSSKNGGAIYADIAAGGLLDGSVTILDTIFNETSSGFGGALVQLSGDLTLNNSQFINSHATFNGGAVYLSYVNGEINNCTFNLNTVDFIEGYPTYGGAVFLDMSEMNVSSSNFTNNYATAGSAIYTYDNLYQIIGSYFENNTNPIYTVYDKEDCVLDNNTYINDGNVSTNNTFFATIITGEGIQFTLINNTINVTNLPSKFDLRDWGWVSPVKDQGWMGACWTFGMIGPLESALLKSTGILTDLSENNMQNTMLRYSIYGAPSSEGGDSIMSVGYLVSWLGTFSQETDVYDEVGKISPLLTTTHDIHVQDVIFIPNNQIPNGTDMKNAILKYGSISVCYFGQSKYDEINPYYNPETYAQYVNITTEANHVVSIVGWDDNFSKENFLITPPGDGAWIVKNSWGTDWGDDGYLYVSYYDKSLNVYNPSPEALVNYSNALFLENTVPYNKNYQYDIMWSPHILEDTTKNISYYNRFEALEDDLIAGVGTYFLESGVNYKVQIYVNDQLKLTQEGISPFIGYHTIKLKDYIPIKKGDNFKAVFTSSYFPYLDFIGDGIRIHYTEGLSFVSFDEGKTWEDTFNLGLISCLKVYTVADNTKIINNKNIAVDYDGGSYFSVKVVTDDGHSVGAGEKVKFTINNKSTTVTTDANGIAKLKIVNLPGKYTITTNYKGASLKNTVTVKQVLTTSKVTVKKTAKKFYLQAKLKINGKLVRSKVISFKLNGKTYKAKTNSKGIAKVIVKNNLKKGKTYTFTVTYLKDTIKSTVKVSR
ncbi:C1 family peptidase [Methanobrevibacter sp.]